MKFIFFIVTVLSITASALPPPNYHTFDLDFIEDLPFITIQIENQKARVLLDTGARNQVIVLKERILEKLVTIRKFAKKELSTDITGKEYIAEKYILPEFNMGEIKFLQARVTQDTNWGLTGGGAKGILNSKDGAIGLELFVNKAFIIDYPNEKLVVIDRLIPVEYDIDNWHDINFKVDRYGLNLFISVDYDKSKRFILDTGANISLIKDGVTGISQVHEDCLIELSNEPCKYIESQTLVLENIELPNMKFYLYTFPRGFEPDGIIGYNFLKDKVIFVDFNQRIFRMKIY